MNAWKCAPADFGWAAPKRPGRRLTVDFQRLAQLRIIDLDWSLSQLIDCERPRGCRPPLTATKIPDALAGEIYNSGPSYTIAIGTDRGGGSELESASPESESGMSSIDPRDVPLNNSAVIGLVSELSNWGRWGADDQRGTLNHIDDECRRRAATLVREGVVISCAWPLGGHGFHSPGSGPQRFMIRSGEGLFEEHSVPPIQPELAGRARLAAEYIGLRFHGLEITHIDALSHVFWDGRAYNDVPAASVSTESGATQLDVTHAGGIVTRGVLLDIAAQRGVEYLEPGTRVMPEDLEAAEERQGIRVGKGDAVLLRTGHGRRCQSLGFVDSGQADARSGWHVSCLRWLHERDVALIGNDGTNDAVPFEFSEMPLPVHTIGIVAMGLWLIDNCNLEDLAEICDRMNRYEFLFTLAPLLLVGATGSPANPLATF